MQLSVEINPYWDEVTRLPIRECRNPLNTFGRFTFRRKKSSTCCILCGKEKLRQETISSDNTEDDFCMCRSSVGCELCERDILARTRSGNQNTLVYACETHGAYRRYEDSLIRYKVLNMYMGDTSTFL